jgi:hypothetical protein
VRAASSRSSQKRARLIRLDDLERMVQQVAANSRSARRADADHQQSGRVAGAAPLDFVGHRQSQSSANRQSAYATERRCRQRRAIGMIRARARARHRPNGSVSQAERRSGRSGRWLPDPSTSGCSSAMIDMQMWCDDDIDVFGLDPVRAGRRAQGYAAGGTPAARCSRSL